MKNPSKGFCEVVVIANLKDCTPLHLAATYGHLGIFQDLREAGADLFLLNDQKQSVLHKACQVNS